MLSGEEPRNEHQEAATQRRWDAIQAIFHQALARELWLWLALIAGVAFRLRLFLFNRSLWLDEAYLAVNIINRGLLELAQPLSYNQIAPLGFLLASKAMVALLGTAEMVLKFLPLLAGIGALTLTAYFARQALEKTAAALAVGLLAISPTAVYFSAEFKPYSFDIAITAGLIWLGWSILNQRLGDIPRWLVALTGALLVWFSLPAIFTLSAIALVDVIDHVAGRQWRRLRRWLPVYAAWAASFLLMLPQLSSSRQLLASLDHWDSGYLPLWPLNSNSFEWLMDSLVNLPPELLGVSLWSGAVLLALLGLFAFLKERAKFGLFLLAIPSMALAASAAETYPFRDRAVTFLAPLIALWIAAGFQVVLHGFKERRGIAAVLLGAVLLAAPLLATARDFINPPRREFRAVFSEFLERWQTQDEVYVYYGAEPLVRYYSSRFAVDDGGFFYGERSRGNPDHYLEEIGADLGSPRVWFIFHHDFIGPAGLEREFIMQAVDCYGDELYRRQLFGAYVFLYDFSVQEGSPHQWQACAPVSDSG